MSGIVGLGLAGLAAGWWAASWGGRTAWFVAGTLVALLAYAILVYAATRASKLRVERSWGEKSAWYAGERMQADFRIRLAWPVPGVWLRVEEDWIHQGTGEAVTVLASGPAGLLGEARLTGCTRELPRGAYQAAERLLIAGDAFGLLRLVRRQPLEGQLLVLPRSMAASAVPGAAEETARRGKRAAADPSVPQLLLGTRPYAPGDPLRRIHWRSSARTGELRAKETELPAAGRQLLCLDAAGAGIGAAAAPRGGRVSATRGAAAGLAALWADPALAAAVEAAAGIARGALERGQGVRLAVSDGRAGAVEASPHGRGRLEPVLAALAGVPQALPRPEAFAELVAREALAAGGAGVTAVTARPDAGLAAVLRRLKKGSVHVVCVYGPWWPGGEGALGSWRRELEALGCAVTLAPAERFGTYQGGAVYAVTS